MSQRNIGHLPFPPVDYRVTMAQSRHGLPSRFETISACREQDDRRGKGLESAARNHHHTIDVSAAGDLARRLQGVTVPETLASSRYMRDQRIRAAGALWQMVVETGIEGVTTFTIIPANWEFLPYAFAVLPVAKLLRGFRKDLYGVGAARTRGWLIVYVHGEFDPIAGVFRLHLHGLCSLDMVPLLEALKELPNYRSAKKLSNGEWAAVYIRVWIRRKELTNLPDPLTYLVQSFWPSRPIYVSPEGKRTRVRQKWAIREPYHSMVLLWLDQWQMKDLSLMVGLRVTKAGLTVTRRGR